MQSARVLIDGSSDLVFDYAIGGDHSAVQPGCRVEVMLRNRPATGTVICLSSPDPEWEDKLKPIRRLIDPEPLISPGMMKMAQWVSEYYAVPLEQVMRCLLPETVRQEKHNEKTQKALTLIKDVPDDVMTQLEKRAPRQASLIAMLTHLGGKAPLRDVGGSDALASARSLAQKGYITIEEESIHRNPDADQNFVQTTPLSLNKEQSHALSLLDDERRHDAPKPQVLQGVTGSGKTEVYLQLAEKVIRDGKSVLILVPEISLTPQTVHRFKSRFAYCMDKVAVLHSSLSQGERFDEWHRIRRGESTIVIGARSAIYAPMQSLGLIIVDEEHDGSYKQESPPRYHARDVSVLRGHIEKALVVLGSATPSLESLLNVRKGKYGLIHMSQRVDNQSLPIIKIVDMKMESKKNNKNENSLISDKLRASVDQRLNKGEQVILFLNRRGFARSLQCPDCGHVMFCPHCDLAMTYHKTDDRLICHLCSYQSLAPRACPECQSLNILLQGYGTQKAEEIIRKLFPTARIERIDADISKRKNAVRDILTRFRSRKIDILLGTQMIAKGLDFPGVTLVGILNADMGLHIPDFRAGERTFQLLTQVAGRSGRGDLEGEVIIQTFTPHSPSIQFARHHDSDGYTAQELEMRQTLSLPPFSHMVLITIRSTHERKAEFAAQTLHRKLKEKAAPGILDVLTDPLPAPITKAHGQFRFQICLTGPLARPLARIARETITALNLPDDIHAVLDVDPISFL